MFGNPLISQFSIGSMSFYLNPINWWAIPLNYIARNLGKAVGWAIVSPFTVPANLVIKAYYGIKRTILNLIINNGLKQLEPQDLAKNWFENGYQDNIGASRIAQHVNANDLFTGLMAHHSNKLSNSIENGFSAPIIPEERYKDYCEAREKALVSERKWSLAKTILSGIFLIPLFFTIPAYKNLALRHNEERALFEINAGILTELRAIQDKRDSENQSYSNSYGISNFSSPKEYSQEDSHLYFECGKTLLEKGRSDLAFSYFSKVPEGSVHYKEAMQECGNLLLVTGKHQLATEYFLKAGDAQASNISGRLARNPDALVSDITTVSTSESKENTASVLLPAPVSQARILGTTGVFAQPPSSSVGVSTEVAQVRGLDEEDESSDLSVTPADQTNGF